MISAKRGHGCRIFDLERRFIQTGRKGVLPLSDNELLELKEGYDSIMSYFEHRKDRTIWEALLYRRNSVDTCIHARDLQPR